MNDFLRDTHALEGISLNEFQRDGHDAHIANIFFET